MKILLDNCTHKRVRSFFPGHDVKTAWQARLHELDNGELFAAAAQSFDVFITTDKNIRHQHNLEKLPISVIELAAQDTRLNGLLPLQPYCADALEKSKEYCFVSVKTDGTFDLLAPKTKP